MLINSHRDGLICSNDNIHVNTSNHNNVSGYQIASINKPNFYQCFLFFFVFALCFLCFFDRTNDGLAYLIRSSGNPITTT